MLRTLTAVIVVALHSVALAEEVKLDDFSMPLKLMRSTFKIETDGGLGTGFVLAHILSDGSGVAKFVLVTANHVLTNSKKDFAIVHLRKRAAAGFDRLPIPIQIRRNGAVLWTFNADRDLAVMEIPIPQEADIREASPLSTTLLADDGILQKYEVQPGDELMVLGFPFGAEANVAGFPILRSGRVASYPLLPTELTASFLLDFEVFPGNSGGPVFLYDQNRFYEGSMHIGRNRFIVGLVSKQKEVSETVRSMDEERTLRHRLALAEISYASDIRKLIEKLYPGSPIPKPE